MAVFQSAYLWQVHRYREQAPSHSLTGCVSVIEQPDHGFEPS